MDSKAKDSIEKAIQKWVTDKLNKNPNDIDFNHIVTKMVNVLIENDVFVVYLGFKICKN